MVAFIARTIVFNLLHFISNDRKHKTVSIASLQFFQKFLTMWLTGDENKKIIVAVFHDLLSTIVDKLVSSALQTDDLGTH